MMMNRLEQFFGERFSIPQEQVRLVLNWIGIGIAGLAFVLTATVIIAFDSVFLQFSSTTNLQVGQIADRDLVAPPNGGSFVSQILTQEARQRARENVQPIYSSPQIEIATTWDQRAEEALDFIDNVRAAGRYDTIQQQLGDLELMDFMQLSPENMNQLLTVDEDTWGAIQEEVGSVLERAYRTPLNEGQVQNYIDNQLPFQISVDQFGTSSVPLILDLVDDFINATRLLDTEAMAEEAELLAQDVDPIELRFVGGQTIVPDGGQITELDYEALLAFNLVEQQERRVVEFARAMIATMVTVAIFGLYLSRFTPTLFFQQTQRLTLLAVIFLIMLALTRFLGIEGNIHLFPVAAMSLLFVAISGAQVSVISTLGLAFLVSLIANDSMEIATLIVAGGLIGILGLQRVERLNQFFFAGALVGLINVAVIIIFNMTGDPSVNTNLAVMIITGFISGALLVPATTLAAMYLVTIAFNMPTALKLIDLQQPNKPLLQRLLREAPGTYQHSLQVGNLAEQAANAIGADAQLTHVAALYHDIGKMHNPLYFTENQQDILGNPHDTLNDPYRSADIIISHITEGDEIAKQAGLPQRIRDFIREHHGTTQVFVFYQRALKAADGDESSVDIGDFTYPGPKPRSKETAILMLADSCEAAVRSIKPTSRQEISELVSKIIDSKRSEGQLDESGLTLNDIRTIRDIFVDILQGIFHPRINYREAVEGPPKTPPPQATVDTAVVADAVGKTTETTDEATTTSSQPDKRTTSPNAVITAAEAKSTTGVNPIPAEIADDAIADEEPMDEVPRLPSLNERRATATLKSVNDDDDTDTDDSAEQEDDS